MKKRLTDWMDELPVQYLDEIDAAEKARGKNKKTAYGQRFWMQKSRRGWAAAACCAALLAAVLNWEPLILKANEIFLKSRVYYNDLETFFDGEMKALDISIPEDMEPVYSQVSIWSFKEHIFQGDTKERYQKTGLRKVYDSMDELQEELGMSVLPEEMKGLAGEALWFTYYDTSRDKEAIIDMRLNVSGQEEPVYLEINMLLETKKEHDRTSEPLFVDIGIVMSGISSAENERKTKSGKTYLTFRSRRPHYQLIGDDAEDDPDASVTVYHQAQKMLTPGYEQEVLFFMDGMRYYLYGIETEEIAEELADAFLEAR